MRHIKLAGARPHLDPTLNLRRISGPCVVDLSLLAFATPLDLVALACLLNSAGDGAGVTLIPPTDPQVSNYLQRMDLPAFFDGRVVVSPGWVPETPRDETPSLIELTRVRRTQDVQAIIDRLMPKLMTVLPGAACRQVFQIISELLENAATHGESAVGSFIAAQYYTGATSGMPPGFWIGVADAGVGFRAHMARNWSTATSTASMRSASLPNRASVVPAIRVAAWASRVSDARPDTRPAES